MDSLLIVAVLCFRCVTVVTGEDAHNPAFHSDGKANYYKLQHHEKSPGMFDVIIWYKADEEGARCVKVLQVYLDMASENPIVKKYWRRFWRPFAIEVPNKSPWQDSGLPIEIHYWTHSRSRVSMLHRHPAKINTDEHIPRYFSPWEEHFLWVASGVINTDTPLIVDLRVGDCTHREFFVLDRDVMRAFFHCLEKCRNPDGNPCTGPPKSKYRP